MLTRILDSFFPEPHEGTHSKKSPKKRTRDDQGYDASLSGAWNGDGNGGGTPSCDSAGIILDVPFCDGGS